MKVEFTAKFKVGDVVALKEEYDGIRTGKTRYFLLGCYKDLYYHLSNIETGELLAENRDKDYIDATNYSIAELTDLINYYDGVIYSGDKVKLVIEK